MQSIIDVATAIRDNARHEQIAQLVDYWLSICPPDKLPGRAHFDPIDIPKILPYIVMTDVERDLIRFRYRLVGTAIVRATNMELTGKYLDGVVEDFENSDLYRARLDLVASLQPYHYDGDPPPQWSKGFSGTERVFLPLATDGETVDIILGACVYRRADGSAADDALAANGG